MSIETFVELASMVAHAASGAQLDDAQKRAILAHAAGRLTDGEAETVFDRVQAARGKPAGFVVGVGAAAVGAVAAARRARRSKPAEARERMRGLAYGAWLPRPLAAGFSNGELAALSAIGAECARRGFCDLPVGTIAWRAGVSERTVQYARHRAVQLGLLTVHHRGTSKNRLGSVVRIVSREWLAWLAKRVPAKGCKTMHPCRSSSEVKRLPEGPGRSFVASGGGVGGLRQRKSPGG